MDLTYNYNRDLSKGSLNGKTGNLTHIVNNLDRNKDRKYEYDSLGRLIKSKGGAAAGGTGVANWTQNYGYDRYGNKTTTTKSGITANSAAIPLDGLASQTYQAATNRITTSGTTYDKVGNMTRGKAPNGTFQKFEYDAANRLVKIKTDAGALLEEYTYGASRERIKKTVANGDKTYYAWGGSSVIAEYKETASQTTMNWAKSYIYAGSRLLSTITKNGASETIEYQHPDRLGTKLITNTSLNTAKEQATLPFGTEITAETQATSNQRFTSYDRSGATGLDYAVNRTYNSGQSRFTQVDPIGMASASIGNPQSMNMFAYVENDPIGFVDPSGLDIINPDDPIDITPKEGSNCTIMEGGVAVDGKIGSDGRCRILIGEESVEVSAQDSILVSTTGTVSSNFTPMPIQSLPEKLTGSYLSLTTDRDRVRNKLSKFLDKLAGPCATALKALKLTKKSLLAAFDRAKFVSRLKFASGFAKTGLTSRGPIRTKTGVGEFLKYDIGFLVHELVHTATRRGDSSVFGRLIRAGIKLSPVKKTVKRRGRTRKIVDYSQTLSDFFNNNCR